MYKVKTVIASNVNVLGAAIETDLNSFAKKFPEYKLHSITQGTIKSGFADDYTAVLVFEKK